MTTTLCNMNYVPLKGLHIMAEHPVYAQKSEGALSIISFTIFHSRQQKELLLFLF